MADRRLHRPDVPQVGIVGCGAIGSAFDEARPPDAAGAMSHAGAFCAHPGFELAALCDTDAARLEAAGQRWRVAARHADAAALLEQHALDLLCICTPVTARLALVEAALDARVPLVLCEKPLARTLDEARQIVELARASDSVVAVNYLRRWVPAFERVARSIQRGELGAIQRVVATYGKGMANNGSHLIDLLCWFFGRPRAVVALDGVDDGRADDPTFDARIEFAALAGAGRGFVAHFVATDHRCYTAFELDIIGERGRIQLRDGGRELSFSSVGPPNASGYRALEPTGTPERLDIASFMPAVAEGMRALLDSVRGTHDGSDEPLAPACDLDDALLTLEIVDALGRSRLAGGARIALEASDAQTKDNSE